MIKVNHIFIIFVVILIALLGSCESSTEPKEKSDIEKIYLLNSLDMFEEYLTDWENEIRPVDGIQINQMLDVEKNIYQIYQVFYDPSNLGKYCTISRCSEFGNDIYSNLEYFIVQNEIQYTFNEYEDRDTILNFRPKLELSNSILFLTNKYIEELNSFLDNDQHGEDLSNRYEFLNTKLKILHGHWVGWHFNTHPEVSIININKNLDSATVQFRIVYEGGEANFAKKNDIWEMYESKLTWIE